MLRGTLYAFVSLPWLRALSESDDYHDNGILMFVSFSFIGSLFSAHKRDVACCLI